MVGQTVLLKASRHHKKSEIHKEAGKSWAGLETYEGVSKSFRTESVDNEINNNNKHSLRSKKKDFDGKSH
jgi:hypothetical protein